MQYTARLALLLCFGIFTAKSLHAQHGMGGGHMSGGFSGHSAGQATGHAIGHSLGKMFGRHGGRTKGNVSQSARAEEPPLAGAVFVKGRVIQAPGPAFTFDPRRPRFPRDRFDGFPFRHRFGVFPFLNRFGSCPAFTGFGFPRRNFFFGNDFDCFSAEFFFDPFFLGSFSGDLGFEGGFVEHGGSGALKENSAPDGAAVASEESGHNFAPADASNSSGRAAEGEGLPASEKNERVLTLLVLQEGSMYGLTDYWLDGNRLHYVTSYGAENSVPIESIDFVKTFRANEERGIPFAPRLKPAAQ